MASNFTKLTTVDVPNDDKVSGNLIKAEEWDSSLLTIEEALNSRATTINNNFDKVDELIGDGTIEDDEGKTLSITDAIKAVYNKFAGYVTVAFFNRTAEALDKRVKAAQKTASDAEDKIDDAIEEIKAIETIDDQIKKDVNASVETAKGYSSSAQISSVNAATYASAANASAAAAQNAEQQANTYKETAATSANAALEYRNDALQLANNAKNYANIATGASADASNYASAAATSASNARVSADNAEYYYHATLGLKTDVETEVETAKQYAENAEESAGDAAASASDALNSSIAASTSATRAANAAINAENAASGAAQQAAAEVATELQGYVDQAAGYAEDAEGYAEDAEEVIKDAVLKSELASTTGTSETTTMTQKAISEGLTESGKVFIAVYGQTTPEEMHDAYKAGKEIIVRKDTTINSGAWYQNDYYNAVFVDEGEAYRRISRLMIIFARTDGMKVYAFYYSQSRSVDSGWEGAWTANWGTIVTTTIPTKTSDLTNDSSFITLQDVPSEVFIAEYGASTSAELEAAYQAGRQIILKVSTTAQMYALEYARMSATRWVFAVATVVDTIPALVLYTLSDENWQSELTLLATQNEIPLNLSDLNNDTGFITSNDLPADNIVPLFAVEVSGSVMVTSDDRFQNPVGLLDIMRMLSDRRMPFITFADDTSSQIPTHSAYYYKGLFQDDSGAYFALFYGPYSSDSSTVETPYLICRSNGWTFDSTTVNIPTKTSDLTNDSNFATEAYVQSAIGAAIAASY